MSFFKDLFARNKDKKAETVMPPSPQPKPTPEPTPAPGQGMGQGQGQGQGPGRQSGGFGAGPEGECVCSSCGARVPHQTGIPCYEQKCPKCGQAMTRA